MTTIATSTHTEQPAVTSSATAIEIHDLTKTYDNFTAVDGISFDIKAGEIFGLLGPNGAGKTTTIDLIVGLRAPSSGSVRVLGLDPLNQRDEFTARVAVQPQEANLFDNLTVVETLNLFASFHETPRSVAEMAELIGLTDQLKVRAKKLSGGQRRRLLLGVALIGNPEIAVLDEPSAGLDPSARHELWNLITSLRKRGTTVLLTTHHMDEATALCDRVAIMVDGRVVAIDAPNELVRTKSSERRVSFTVSTVTETGFLHNHPDIREISETTVADGKRIAVVTADADNLVLLLAQQGVRTRDLAIETQSLEDVFLELAATSDYSSRVSGTSKKGKNR